MTNPILTELDGLSPAAKQSLQQAHQIAAPTTAQMAAPMITPEQHQQAASANEAPPPAMSHPMPSAVPSLGSGVAPQIKAPIGTSAGDTNELSRLKTTGSGISQIQNPGLRTVASIGDTLGSIFAPKLEKHIPGTEEHHKVLVDQSQNAVNTDLANEGRQATTQHEQAVTAGLPQEESDKHALTQANVGNLNSESTAREHPKEDWKELAGFTGANGEPLEINSATGETRPANVAGAKKTTKDQTPQQQTFDDLIKGGMTPIQAYEKTREKSGGTTINQGTWSLDEQNGKPVLFNSKTGEVKPAPEGLAKTGTAAKATALTAPAQQALEYAKSYGDRTAHTGPGDEALMEKFFELAKPSTGFRMSQPQIDMLKGAQSWMNGLEAHIRHAATGTWFSDEQRKQIIDTMTDLGDAKGIHGGGEVSTGGGSGKGVNLKDAMALPQNKGKSEDEVSKDIEAHGHKVIR